MEHVLINNLMRQMDFKIEDIVDQNIALLRAVLDDADRYNWSYQQTMKNVKGVFSYERSHNVAHILLIDFIDNATLVLAEMKQPITTAILATK